MEEIQEQEIHLSDYLIVIYERKKMIISVFLMTIFLTLWFSFTVPPIYESRAKLLIENEGALSPITGERVEYESYLSQSQTFNTHFELIISNPVINNIIDALELERVGTDNEMALEVNPIKEFISQIRDNLNLLLQKEKQELTSHERRLQLIDKVREKIHINQVQDTKLLVINVKDKYPAMAADIANAMANEYIEFDMANKMGSSKQTLDWLNSELYELRKRLEDAEKAFFDYKQENKLFSIAGKEKMIDQKISEFNNRYLETRNQRLTLDARINEISSLIKSSKGINNFRSLNVGSLVDNPIIDNLYKKMVDIELELTRQSRVFKRKHPKIIQLKSELEKSWSRCSEEIKKELNNLKSERNILLTREQNLEKTISEFEADALDTSSKELKYTILQRNVNTSQKLYDLMLSKIKESDILQSSNTSNIRIVESGTVPIYPVSPNKKRNLLLGAVLGLFAGVGLAFFLQYLDRTIRTEEDIQKLCDLPVLSVVPEADTSVGSYSYGA
jgi:polysaccharide biosynthesis transport protein